VLVVPLYLAVSTIVESADRISELGNSLRTSGIPPPPEWVASVPLVGPKLSTAWQREAAGGGAALVEQLAPYARGAASALASRAGSFGASVVQFLLTVVIAALLYASGEAAALALRRFFRRLAGQRGEQIVILAGQAIRSVALGVVVTALVQTALTGIGLAIAGVPHAGLLAAVALVLCIAQVGPALVLIPAVIWLFVSGSTGLGVFLVVWSVGTLTVDNVLRPWLIKRGAHLPLWLIFSGVIGGLIAFGVIGLFIGPVALAVAYTLVGSWVDELGPEPAPPGPSP
jgi:predicted PurR-regulated permease PerM